MNKFVFCLSFTILLFSCVSGGPIAQTSSQNNPKEDTSYSNRAEELVTGKNPSTQDQVNSNQTVTGPIPSSQITNPSAINLSQADLQVLDQYISNMKYMVYFDEKAVMDSQIAKLAVLKADKYLNTELGVSIVDFEEIEKQKTDLRNVYQKETGGSIDFIQYVAQKVNADIYIELSYTGSSYTENGKYYATASGSIKVFDTSTSELYASETFMMPQPAFSISNEKDALTNAVVGSVYTTMPRIKAQIETVRKKMTRGISYQLILQKTQNQDLVDEFEYELGKKLGKVEAVSYSSGETKFNIYTFKTSIEIKRAISDIAKLVGFNDIYRVSQFYKVYIYNTGM